MIRNTGTSVVALERVVAGTIALGESWGGQGAGPFAVRLEAGDEIRLVDQTVRYGCRDCDRGYADSVLREGIVGVLTFEGADEQGRRLRVPVRIRLDSGSGPVIK